MKQCKGARARRTSSRALAVGSRAFRRHGDAMGGGSVRTGVMRRTATSADRTSSTATTAESTRSRLIVVYIKKYLLYLDEKK